MKSGTNDKMKGTFHQAKGKVKQVTGQITDTPKLEARGAPEKTAGKAQRKLGDVKEAFKN